MQPGLWTLTVVRLLFLRVSGHSLLSRLESIWIYHKPEWFHLNRRWRHFGAIVIAKTMCYLMLETDGCKVAYHIDVSSLLSSIRRYLEVRWDVSCRECCKYHFIAAGKMEKMMESVLFLTNWKEYNRVGWQLPDVCCRNYSWGCMTETHRETGWETKS